MTKLITKTVRLSQKDIDIIEEFQNINPLFENFSTLVRVAILDLASKRGMIAVKSVVREIGGSPRPSFLWDYDLGDAEIREILSGPREKARWLIARILEHSKFDEVWKYLTLEQIERELPHLRLPKKVLKHWKFAIKRWKSK